MKIDFETLKPVVPFGSFIFGFINLLIRLYEKIIAKPKLEVNIEYSGLGERNNEIYFKIDLNIAALNDDVSLKEVFLFSNESVFNRRKLPLKLLFYHIATSSGSWVQIYDESFVDTIILNKAVKDQKLYYTGDIAKLENMNNFIERWSCLPTEDFEENIRGLKIAKHSRLFYTFVGRLIVSEDFTNSDSKLLGTNWYIGFDYGVGQVKKRVFEKRVGKLKSWIGNFSFAALGR
jgi:hypothetical protein